ncbi:MAG: sodium:alanine symporter family protein, partial [Methyloceanibacter sp.]
MTVMEAVSAGLTWLNDIVWGVPMLILILGIGLYLTIGLRLRSVTKVPLSVAFLWKGRVKEGKGEITPF